MHTILGIESSCDDSAVGLFHSQKGLLQHAIYSQSIHQQYGGVVPELASRDHQRKIIPLINHVLQKAKVDKKDIDGIAYTKGPGLVGALLVGSGIAQSLSIALNIPCIGIHHLEAHILAIMLEKSQPKPPFITLLVSGGHTYLIEVKSIGDYQILGQTLDDAAGEAFDKIAKYLELPYPGGPHLAKIATKGDPKSFPLPIPLKKFPKSLDFSFSGLKTATRKQWLSQSKKDSQTKANLAASFEHTVVTLLSKRCLQALHITGHKQLVIAGGVAANHQLRLSLSALASKENFQVFFPRQEFCTDNGAMVAYTGWLRLQKKLTAQEQHSNVRARWPLTELEAIKNISKSIKS
jgi:N6-L-threonylcarbamoyladenine synthase